MEKLSQDQKIIMFAKQLADSNLEYGQYDLIMKEYIRLQKNSNEHIAKEQKINFLELLSIFAFICGLIFLEIFIDKVSESSYPYIIVSILLFIIGTIALIKGKPCSH
ncbi:MAG: hypothetical protein PHW18_12345 [Sulfuricurvum sp.]|uniref:hypothetical protein n=1 Tax=Sulfuricurvum sp. TaxID=2025608 RepID=UPI0026255140|nr:hypothetical protein [Sulfuricurvum sp.]MDD2830356.1 hypothetical protein [Sulfuricurvum sp.]MDD4950681.1 hypothetical protein [Sulfuricurvum sp.]